MAGVHPATYWLSTLTWDFLLYAVVWYNDGDGGGHGHGMMMVVIMVMV